MFSPIELNIVEGIPTASSAVQWEVHRQQKMNFGENKEEK